MMDQTFDASQIVVGFHPDGYRIDKTVMPLNWYTQWDIQPGHRWRNPVSVCFDALPKQGWVPTAPISEEVETQ